MRKIFKSNKIINKTFIIIATSILVLLINTPGMPKYALIPFLSGLSAFLFFNEFEKKWLVILVPNMFYVIWGGTLAVLQSNFDYFSIKIASFLIVPPVVALLLYIAFKDCFEILVDIFFISLVAVYLYTCIPQYTPWDLFESIYAFPFGLFAMYYFSNKKWWQFVISIVVIIMAHKRVAYLGVILCLIAMVMLGLIKQKKIHTIITNIIVVVTGIVAYLWASTDYYKLLGPENFEKYDSGIYFFRGRLHIWQQFRQNIEFSPLFWGKGIGYTTSYLDKYGNEFFRVIHNDYLQIYAEIGFIGFFIYFSLYSIYLMNRCNNKKSTDRILLWAMIMYTFLLWTTDNTQVYISYWIPAWILILDTMFSGKKQGEIIET